MMSDAPMIQNLIQPTIIQTLIEFKRRQRNNGYYREVVREQGVEIPDSATDEQIKDLAELFVRRYWYEGFRRPSPPGLMQEFRAALDAVCGGAE